MSKQQGDTRDRILDVAQELIQRRGLNGMSFQDLSDAVGIRKASIHYHFASKDDMVVAVVNRYLSNFEEATDAILGFETSGLEKLTHYCSLFLQTLQSGENEQGCLCGMLMAEIASLDDASVALIRQFVRGSGRRIEAMIRQGVEDGSVSIQGSASDMARFVLATLEGSLLVARCDGGPEQLARDIDRLLSFLKNH